MIEPARTDPTTPIIVSDLGRCEPEGALSPVPRRGQWRVVPYRSDTFSGTMLVAGDESNAPEVTLPLDVSGWHRISIGVLDRWDEVGMFEVKLSDDPAFCVISAPGAVRNTFREVYWKTADLAGREIVFRQLRNRSDDDDRPAIVRRPGARARIAYVRLDPLAAGEAAAFQADHTNGQHKRLYAHNDANGYMWLYGAAGPDEIRRELEPFRESDFSRVYWEAAMGDILSYPGREGRLPTSDGMEVFDSIGDRFYAEDWRRYRAAGFDPFRCAMDYAHEIGLEFHAGYRPAGFFFPADQDQWNRGGFYEQHPELRAVNHDGTPAPRIAFTYPESRAKVLSILREIAEYGVDGIAIMYIRRPPLVGWEPPLVEAFRAEAGLDARALAPDDERWLRFRCQVLNGFMRELRAELDAVAREQGRTRRLEITAMVSALEEENLRDGMDVAAWVADGTVDTIIPYTMAPDLDSLKEAWPDPGDAEPWVSIVRGTDVKVSLSIMPRWKSPDDYRRTAAALYRAGAESFFFWDCGGQRVNFMDQYAWNAFKRLGHRDEVLAWQDPGAPAADPDEIPHITLLAIPVGRPGPGVPSRPALEIGGYDLGFRTPG